MKAEETVVLLTDKQAMEAIRRGEEARWRNQKNYYVNWEKIRNG